MPEDTPLSDGEKLKMLRKRKGLTQGQVGAQLEPTYSAAGLSLVENNEVDAPMPRLRALIAFYGLTVEQFYSTEFWRMWVESEAPAADKQAV